MPADNGSTKSLSTKSSSTFNFTPHQIKHTIYSKLDEVRTGDLYMQELADTDYDSILTNEKHFQTFVSLLVADLIALEEEGGAGPGANHVENGNGNGQEGDDGGSVTMTIQRGRSKGKGKKYKKKLMEMQEDVRGYITEYETARLNHPDSSSIVQVVFPSITTTNTSTSASTKEAKESTEEDTSMPQKGSGGSSSKKKKGKKKQQKQEEESVQDAPDETLDGNDQIMDEHDSNTDADTKTQALDKKRKRRKSDEDANGKKAKHVKQEDEVEEQPQQQEADLEGEAEAAFLDDEEIPVVERRPLTKQEEDILSQIDQDVKDDFYQIGFSKWDKYFLPVLQLCPFDVSDNQGVRSQWMTMFKNTRKNRRPQTRLVYWYGTADGDSPYSFLTKKNIISYEDGVKKKLHKLHPTIEKKKKNGKKLTSTEAQLEAALTEIQLDLAIPKESRWTPDYDGVEASSDVEMQPEPSPPPKPAKETKPKKKRGRKSKGKENDDNVEDKDEDPKVQSKKRKKKDSKKEENDQPPKSNSKKGSSKADIPDAEVKEEIREEPSSDEQPKKKKKPKKKQIQPESEPEEDILADTSEDDKDDDFDEESDDYEDEKDEDFISKKSPKAKKVKPKSQTKKKKPPVETPQPPKKKGRKSNETKCQEAFDPLIESLQSACNTNNTDDAKEYLQSMIEKAELVTITYLETTGFVKKIKSALKNAFGDNQEIISLRKEFVTLVKKVYEEKQSKTPKKKAGKTSPPKSKVKEGAKTKPDRNSMNSIAMQIPKTPKEKKGEPKLEKQISMENGHSSTATNDITSAIPLKSEKKERTSLDSEAKKEDVTTRTPARTIEKPKKAFKISGLMQPKTPSSSNDPKASSLLSNTKAGQPTWMKGEGITLSISDIDETIGNDPDRLSAIEFLLDAVQCFSEKDKDKVNPMLVAKCLEEASYELFFAESVDVYWERIHYVCAALAGKEDTGTLADEIVKGRYATAKAVMELPMKTLFRSFEGLQSI